MTLAGAPRHEVAVAARQSASCFNTLPGLSDRSKSAPARNRIFAKRCVSSTTTRPKQPRGVSKAPRDDDAVVPTELERSDARVVREDFEASLRFVRAVVLKRQADEERVEARLERDVFRVEALRGRERREARDLGAAAAPGRPRVFRVGFRVGLARGDLRGAATALGFRRRVRADSRDASGPRRGRRGFLSS